MVQKGGKLKMRIEKLKVKNYRQLRDIEISFPEKDGYDLHIFIGDNGAGKTNILNALNWCLYKEEPHLSRESKGLPILNVETEKEIQDGYASVLVELKVGLDGNRHTFFIREEKYQINNGKGHVVERSFRVKELTEDYYYQIYKDEEAVNRVNRFVPKRIREFFFFDNERLDTYFKEATAKNIKDAVFDISQLDIIERIEDRLSNIIRDLRREAGKKNPNIDEKNKKLEDAQAELKMVENQIKDNNDQINLINEKIKELQEELRGVPDVEDLQKEREQLENEKKEKIKFKNEKIKERYDLLFSITKIIYVLPVLKRTVNFIEEKRAKGQLPPPIDKNLLEKIVERNNCEICDRKLDSSAIENVQKLLKNIDMSNDISHILNSTGQQINEMKESLSGLQKKLSSVNSEIKGYEKDLNERIQDRLNDIDKELNRFSNLSKVIETNTELKKYQEELPGLYQNKGSLRDRREEAKSKVNTIKKELEKEYEKDNKHKKIVKQIKYGENLLVIAQKCKNEIMFETKNEIESSTKKLYFNLLWKKETFADVKIDDDYSINLIHISGYEALATVSAAERALLALSFTLALHEISGFYSPVLVDTPVSRTSGKHRENFAATLCNISGKKQAILLFTPDEYTENVSKIMNDKASNRFRFNVIKKEVETEVEVL